MEDQTNEAFVELIASGMILIFVLAVFIAIFIFIYRNRIIRQELALEQLTIEHQRTLIHASIEVIDKERGVFASNLHDEIGAQIALAKMSLSSLGDSELKDHGKETVGNSMRILDDIASSIRQISHNLHPPVLLKLGLVAAVKDYINKIPESNIKIDCIENIYDKRFSELIELHAYRIFQEALSNALKHAKCTELSVAIIEERFLFRMIVKDNGIGINTSKENGLGILNMHARAEMMGFELLISSAKNGTEIQVLPKIEKNGKS